VALTDDEREQLKARLTAKLQPWRIRATLAFAGLYQITHELLKDAVVTEVCQFYMKGFDETGLLYDEERYAEQVLSCDRKRSFRASLLWLVDGGAITTAQADRLDEIYAHRHDLAHELLKYIVDPDFEPDMQLFVDALAILRDIRRFWTQVEVDIGTFEDFGEVSVDDATPVSLMVLQLCIDAYADGLKDAIEEGTATASGSVGGSGVVRLRKMWSLTSTADINLAGCHWMYLDAPQDRPDVVDVDGRQDPCLKSLTSGGSGTAGLSSIEVKRRVRHVMARRDAGTVAHLRSLV
jgi:hypothetical protein